MGLRCARMENAAEHITEEALPKRRLVGMFRVVDALWAVDSAEKITEPDKLTRPPVRFLRHPWRLRRAGGRFRISEIEGESGRMAWSLHHIAATDPRAAWGKKGNRENITGRSHETALGSSVSSPWAFWPPGRPSLPGS